jgi:enoyl-CoA hydratase/carnithine racemase
VAEVSPPVLIKLDGAVAVVKLNRPEARNALSRDLKDALVDCLQKFDADDGVRVVVIAGGDEYFAAGGDLKAMAARPVGDPPDEDGAIFWRHLAAIQKPMIAAVSGYALGGGCELALACDMIVASETAQFGQAEIMVGIIPGGGGTQRLARVVGKQRTMEMVLTGRRIRRPRGPQVGLGEPGHREEGMDRPRSRAGGGDRRTPTCGRAAGQAVRAERGQRRPR